MGGQVSTSTPPVNAPDESQWPTWYHPEGDLIFANNQWYVSYGESLTIPVTDDIQRQAIAKGIQQSAALIGGGAASGGAFGSIGGPAGAVAGAIAGAVSGTIGAISTGALNVDMTTNAEAAAKKKAQEDAEHAAEVNLAHNIAGEIVNIAQGQQASS